jgi:hypothetical protein
MFLPAFVNVGVTAKFLPKLRKSAVASAFLDGVSAAAVALMAVVGLAVCACGNREHAGSCVDGFRCGAAVLVPSEFRVVGVGGSDCWDCAARDRLGLSERTKGQLKVMR